MSGDVLDYYGSQSALSALPDDVELGELPTDLGEMRSVIQKLLVHRNWAPSYGIADDALRIDETQLRSVGDRLRRALAIKDAPIAVAREPIDRVVSICRDFSLVQVALLRAAGTPARMRCGFANYFDRSVWCDHWITERWDGGRWVRDDPQIDELQARAIKVDFDVNDQPPGQFLSGAEAWVATRSGEHDPSIFGIFDMWGPSFIGGNVLLDLACINKVELLPWDSAWELLEGPYNPVPDGAAAVLDDLAALVVTNDFDAIRARYEGDDALRVGSRIFTFVDGVASEVDLPVRD